MAEIPSNTLTSQLENVDKFKKGDYSVAFPQNMQLIPSLIARANPKCKKFMLVTDSNIQKLYGDMITKGFADLGLTMKILVFEPGENNKTMENADKVLTALFENRFNRSDVIIGFGGGLITDFTGFVASIFKRGMRYVSIPTTVLAMSDAAIGSKTGVNNAFGKNMIGSFYDPILIVVCASFLNSLDDRNLSNGLSEVIKIAAMLDVKLFEKLEENDIQSLRKQPEVLMQLIRRSMELKIEVVSEDKLESDWRMILNYGHTIGHGIEFASKEKLLHGESVSIGIVLANELALIRTNKEMSDSSQTDANPLHFLRIQRLLERYNLPTKLPEFIHAKEVLFYMSSDKKITDGLSFPFICITEIGCVLKHRVPFTALEVSGVLSKFISVGASNLSSLTKDISVNLPGSKSVANRALVLSALTQGNVQLRNFLYAEDTEVMMGCLNQLKACSFESVNDTCLKVNGYGGRLQFAGQVKINVKNSGTTARFLCGLFLLLQDDQSVIVECSERMKKRPIKDMIVALEEYLSFEYLEEEFCFPFKVHKKSQFKGGQISINSTISSQFVSGLLLAVPLASQPTQVKLISDTDKITSEPFITMTVEMIKQFGGKIERKEKNVFSIESSTYQLQSGIYEIESDAATSSYDMAWSILNAKQVLIEGYKKNGELLLQGDWKFADKLSQLGFEIGYGSDGLRIRGDLKRKQFENESEIQVKFDFNDCTDTFITFCMVCACLEDDREYTLVGIGNQRVKECDRFEAVKVNLAKFNIPVMTFEDGLTIKAMKNNEMLKMKTKQTILIECFDDHRIAMAFSILATFFTARNDNLQVVINQRDCVNKTSPLFFHHLRTTYATTCLYQDCLKKPQQVSNEQTKQSNKNSSQVQPIFIIGMRCSGKSTLSKKMAELLSKKYICMDQMIFDSFYRERFQSLSEGINAEGWVVFRERELAVLNQIIDKAATDKIYANSIVSCGGGLVTTPQAREVLKNMNNIVWLRRDITDIEEDFNQRSDVPAYLQTIRGDYDLRRNFYAEISCKIFSFPGKSFFSGIFEEKEYWKQIEKSLKHFLKNLESNQEDTHGVYEFAADSEFLCMQVDSLKKLNYSDLQYINTQYHALEIRIDDFIQKKLLEDKIDLNIAIEELCLIVSRVRLANKNKLELICTLRSSEEGGSFTGSSELYWQILNLIQKESLFSIFDIELSKIESLKSEINTSQLDKLYNNFGRLIVSRHFISKPIAKPELERLISTLCESAGESDIIKLVLHANSSAYDVAFARDKLSRTHPASIVIKLGESGRISRVENELLTPVYDVRFGQPTGLGQLSHDQLLAVKQQISLRPIQKMFYIFGTDIINSPSPLMHNSAFQKLGLTNYSYKLAQIENVGQIKAYLDSSDFSGATVTMPFKTEVCQYLQQIIGTANLCGIDKPVVNTVVKLNGQLIGFNTDWYGIIKPLRKQLALNAHYVASFKKPYALVIGAGATTMTMVYCLNTLGFTTLILNRTYSKIEKFIGWRGVEKGFSDFETLVSFLNANPQIELSLIASTIPGKAQGESYPSEIFTYRPTIFEASYIPKETSLIRAAKKHGSTTFVYGLDMLLYQGYLQNQIFTGKRVSRKFIQQLTVDAYNKKHGTN